MALSPLLVDARHEYTVQLADLLAPYAMNTIARIYESSKKNTKAFRELLRQVPSWNASQIDERTNEIERRNPQLQDLIAACCVSYTKVLGSIRLNQSQNSNVRIALPQATAFVHSVYIHVAKSFFYEPKLVFADRHAKAALMRDAVDESIRQHVPIQQLLQAYLHVAVDAQGMDPMAAAFHDQPPAVPEASPYHTPARSPMMAAYQPETQQMPIMVPAPMMPQMPQMPQMQPQMVQMQPQMQPQMEPQQPQMDPPMPQMEPHMPQPPMPQMDPAPQDDGPRPEFFDDADFT